MRLNTKRVFELTPGEWGDWKKLLAGNSQLASPYFRPEFAQAVAQVRDDVWIGVVEDAGETVAFFPFQRDPYQQGRPVGGRLSDFHGIIAAPDFSVDTATLLQQTGMSTWNFSHVPVSQRMFRGHHYQTAVSPYLDLRGGFDEYAARLEKSQAAELKKRIRRARQIEREIGPLRLETDTRKTEILRTLMHWKSLQYHATGIADVFAVPWTVQLLHNLLAVRGGEFSGLLSVLYAGEQPLAMHMGMRTERVLHFWFLTYNRAFSKYSPGRVLLLEMARAAEGMGIERIDLGKGNSRFKSSTTSAADGVAEGSVDCRPVFGAMRRQWWRTKHWFKKTSLGATVKKTFDLLRSEQGRNDFQ